MSETQKLRLGKAIFWVTVVFCTWIIWFVSSPPAEIAGMH